MENVSIPSKLSRHFSTVMVTLLIAVVVLGAAGAAGFFYLRNRRLTADARELDSITAQVKKRMILPDETPSLATVTDSQKLQGQSFFKNAENGDKVLIFATAQKAVLYRPQTGQIVEVAPFRVTDTTAEADAGQTNSTPNQEVLGTTTQTPAELTDKSVTTVVLNGTNTEGVTQALAWSLQQNFPELNISKKEKASVLSNGNSVYDKSGKYSDLAQKIAENIKGTVVKTLPAADATNSADIIIVRGGTESSTP